MVPGPPSFCQLSRATVFWIRLISCCSIDRLARVTDQLLPLALAGSVPPLGAPGEYIDPLLGGVAGCPPGKPGPDGPAGAWWTPGCWASSWCWKSMHAGVV